MRPSDLLRNNIIALSLRQPDVAERVASARRNDAIFPQTARDGSPSLATTGNSAAQPLQIHSRYRPVDEARRAIDAIGASATLVVLGMGAMFVPREYLRRFPSATVIVAEQGYPTVRTVLEEIDLAASFGTDRLYIATDEETLQRLITTHHQPAIRDGLSVYELRPWADRPEQAPHFQSLRNVVSRTMREIAGEHAAIRRYSRAWFTHTVENTLRVNLQKAEEAVSRTAEVVRSRPNRILAAGPSLDTFLRRSSTAGRCVADGLNNIVVDTALPALIRRRCSFTGVVTLDPQGWSPLHFRALPAAVPVVWGDWGVTPSLPACGKVFVPLGSAHPLHTLLAAEGLPMLLVPGSRNVTETALRLVLRNGGSVAEVIGADFSYPRGKTYARGTYHYTLAQMRASRLRPMESFFSDQVYPAATLRSPRDGDQGPIFEMPGMAAQKTRTADILAAGARTVHRAQSFTGMDIRKFWENHVEELNRLERKIVGHGDEATPLIMGLLGAHGRAHLPLLSTITDSSGSPDRRVVDLIGKVRGFIFSRLSRY